MDRCALFVDAGYALGNGAFAVHGTRNRDSVSWDYAGLLKLLGSLSRDQTGLPLLRCYWYDIAPVGSRVAEHDALADLPAVKVRLGGSRPGRSEGVETEIRKDLTTLARNGAVSDVIIVSAAEDLAPVIAEVQEYGLRTLLLHYGMEDSVGWRALRQEFDEVIEISATHLRPYVELIAGAEPQYSGAGAEPRYSGAGYPELPAGAQVGAAHPAIEAPAARLLAPALPDGYERANQLPVMINQGQNPRDLLPRAEAAGYPAAPRDDGRGPQAEDGRATRGPAALPQAYPAAEAGGPGLSTVTPSGYGQASFGRQGEAHAANGHGGAGQAPEFSERGRTAGPGVRGSGRSVNADDQSGMAYGSGSAGLSSAAPGTGLQSGNGSPAAAAADGTGRGYPADGRAANGTQAAGPRGDAALAGHEFAVAGPTPPGLPGHGSPGNGQPTGNAQPTGNGPVSGGLPGHASRPDDPNEGGMSFGGPGHSGPHQAVSAQAFRPAGPGAPGPLPPQPPSGQPAQRDSLTPPDAQRPPLSQRQLPPANGSPYGQDRGVPYSGQLQQSSQVVASQQAFGSGSYAPAPPSVGDAVQSAHAEGYGFGEAVARDAPALWLEAVLARKPRMPSDLEARLLQGSALPIDSLLHDEVRHALRRGFWDALERSRH